MLHILFRSLYLSLLGFYYSPLLILSWLCIQSVLDQRQIIIIHIKTVASVFFPLQWCKEDRLDNLHIQISNSLFQLKNRGNLTLSANLQEKEVVILPPPFLKRGRRTFTLGDWMKRILRSHSKLLGHKYISPRTNKPSVSGFSDLGMSPRFRALSSLRGRHIPLGFGKFV